MQSPVQNTSNFIRYTPLSVLLIPFLFAGCPKKETVYASPVPLTTVGVSVPEGELIIFNEPATYFTFVIEGEQIENVERGGMPLTLNVDGTQVQMTTTAIADFYSGDFAKTPDHDLLTMHQAYEVQWLAAQAGSEELGLYRQHVTLANGRGCLVWTFDSPTHPTHLMVTTVLRPRILLLSAVVEGNSQDRLLDLLLSSMESLERRESPIDVKWIRDSVIILNKRAERAGTGK